MADLFINLIVYTIYILAYTLFHVKDLHQGAAPLDIWIIVEWVQIIAIVIMCGVSSVRLRGAEIIIIPTIVIFGAWNIAGCGFFIISAKDSPEGMPANLLWGLGTLLVIASLIAIAFFVFVCVEGVKVFYRFFHAENENIRILEEINNFDDIDARIGQMNNVDGYALFPAEIEKLKSYCQVNYEPNMDHSGGDSEGIICLDELESGISIIRFPIGNHKYHPEGLLNWIKTRTNCPMGRRGIRSSLLRKIHQEGGRADTSRNIEMEQYPLFNPNT